MDKTFIDPFPNGLLAYVTRPDDLFDDGAIVITIAKVNYNGGGEIIWRISIYMINKRTFNNTIDQFRPGIFFHGLNVSPFNLKSLDHLYKRFQVVIIIRPAIIIEISVSCNYGILILVI